MVLKKIITNDGSITFFNDKVGESYHSISGALEEALKKHVEPSEFLFKKDLIIGDLFFGLGYNSIVALKKYFEINPQGRVEIFAFENDLKILNEIRNIVFPEEYLPYQEIILKTLNDKNIISKSKSYKLFRYETSNIIINLFLGDIKETLILVKENIFDIVYYDSFSPKKMPDFWTEDFFSLVFKTMKTGSLLTTYSCARKVRENLKLVGFKVEDGPIVGRKSPGTLAFIRKVY